MKILVLTVLALMVTGCAGVVPGLNLTTVIPSGLPLLCAATPDRAPPTWTAAAMASASVTAYTLRPILMPSLLYTGIRASLATRPVRRAAGERKVT